MASIKENNLELNYGWPYGESGWNSGMDENLVKLGFESRKRVKGILSAPPSTPSNGDAYIVGTSPTGLFSGKFANIAIYDRNSWIFIVPKSQEVVFNAQNGCEYLYDNGWSFKLEEEKSPYIKVKDFTFSTGYTITDQRQCLLNLADNKYYQWSGAFPKVVPAGSTPATAGGIGPLLWVDRTDLMLREELAQEESDVIVAGIAAMSLVESYKNTSSNVISLSRMFGASNGSDITTALSNAISYSKLNGYIPVVIDLVSAYISGPLPVLNSSFEFVPIFGLGKNKTSLDVSAAGDSCITLSGGSGGSGGVILGGMSIKGTATQKPLKNTGFCGARCTSLHIDCGTAAVLSNNIATGTFTEFFIFDACELNVSSVFEMSTGAGNDSFHGCGLTNRCIVNEKETSVGLFKVGAVSDTKRTVWYNAPLDMQVFKRTSSVIIKTQNSLSNIITTTGNVTVENFTATPQTFSAINGASRHSHAGSLNSWNGSISAGSCIFSNLFSTYPSGHVGGGISEPRKNTVTGTSTTIPTGISDISGNGRLAHVSVTAANYEYCCLVFYAGRISPFINPVAVIVATSRAFDSAGYGSPIFTVSDYELIVSNANWAGTITVTSIGLSSID